MDDAYCGEAAELSLREEINRRMAALSPERLITPKVKRDKEMHFLRMATDEIKRLHTLCDMLDTEHDAIEQKKREVGRDAKERFLQIGPDESNKEFETPGTPLFAAHELIKTLDEKLRRNDSLGRQAIMNLLLEIRHPHKELDGKQIFVCDDWSLCSIDEDLVTPAVITRVVFRAIPVSETNEPSVVPPKKYLH